MDPDKIFIHIHILNYDNASNYIYIKKCKDFINHTCNLINQEKIANQFYIF